MLKPARFLCFGHSLSELTHKEASRQIKDAIMTVTARVHTLIFDAGCELRRERSVRMHTKYNTMIFHIEKECLFALIFIF